MLDLQLRPLKDRFIDPTCRYVPLYIKPSHITGLGFVCGLLSAFCAYGAQTRVSLFFWLLNRLLDCLDGALARYRKTESDLGGFLDLLADFTIYSLIPIGIAQSWSSKSDTFVYVALLESTFHINNFILFFAGTLAEKGLRNRSDDKAVKELTSVMMRPALIEGAESGVLFTLMLAFPFHIRMWCQLMAGLVMIGIVQRTFWMVAVLN